MSKAKEQRIVFILRDEGKGELQTSVEFFPRLPLSNEGFMELAPAQQNLSVIASNIGKIVMDGLKRTMEQEAAEGAEEKAVDNSQPEELHAAAGEAIAE